MLSLEEFESAVAPLKDALELRRRKYQRYFYSGVAIGLALLGISLVAPQAALNSVQQFLHARPQITSSDIFAFRLFALLVTLMLAFGPIVSYRGTRGLSVAHALAARLFGFFGPFIPAFGGAIAAPELRAFSAGAFLSYPEEGVSGEMNGVRARLCEASLIAREGGADTLVFHGLVILADWPHLIAGERDAANAGLRAQLAHVTGGNGAGLPPSRRDEKALYAASGLYARVKERFLDWSGKDELPSERIYRLKFHLAPRLLRPVQPAQGDFAPYVIEYVEQSCMVLIPGVSGFFTLGSLFSPALSMERLRHFYAVMQVLDSVTLHQAYMPARTLPI